MKVQWAVEDGYSGKSRPQFVEIDDSEFEGCETQEEVMDVINCAIQRDFEDKITFRFVRVVEEGKAFAEAVVTVARRAFEGM